MANYLIDYLFISMQSQKHSQVLFRMPVLSGPQTVLSMGANLVLWPSLTESHASPNLVNTVADRWCLLS